MTTRQQFHKKVMGGGSTIWMAGAYDALSATLIDQSNFDGIFTTGFGVSASLLGTPDLEIYTLTENLNVVNNIVNAVKKPVVADTDTGYGNVINVMRTVRDFEKAGVAALILEDQRSPKKCPAAAAEFPVLPIQEATAKIKAAVDARKDPHMIIVVRTDAVDPNEAIDRACAYAEAGADLIQPISRSFKGFEDLIKLKTLCQRRLSLQLMEGIWMGDLTKEQVESVAAFATYPLVPMMSAIHAIQTNLNGLHASKSFAGCKVPQTNMKDYKELIGFERIQDLQKHYETMVFDSSSHQKAA